MYVYIYNTSVYISLSLYIYIYIYVYINIIVFMCIYFPHPSLHDARTCYRSISDQVACDVCSEIARMV